MSNLDEKYNPQFFEDGTVIEAWEPVIVLNVREWDEICNSYISKENIRDALDAVEQGDLSYKEFVIALVAVLDLKRRKNDTN